MLHTQLLQIESDAYVVSNGSHHFRLQHLVENTTLETIVHIVYRPPCSTQYSCVQPVRTFGSWILLCLSTAYNTLSDIEFSVPPVSRASYPLSIAECGPCNPSYPSVEVRLPRVSPVPSYSALRASYEKPTPPLSASEMAAIGATASIAILLIVFGIIQIIVPRLRVARAA
jgi:hypothetical protein